MIIHLICIERLHKTIVKLIKILIRIFFILHYNPCLNVLLHVLYMFYTYLPLRVCFEQKYLFKADISRQLLFNHLYFMAYN